ncbi:MAG: hypothetical protein AB7F35_19460 [Acetobacteraceae bacterium]
MPKAGGSGACSTTRVRFSGILHDGHGSDALTACVRPVAKSRQAFSVERPSFRGNSRSFTAKSADCLNIGQKFGRWGIHEFATIARLDSVAVF